MTESDWNACADPQPMLEFLRGKVSDRKLPHASHSQPRSGIPDTDARKPARGGNAAAVSAVAHADGIAVMVESTGS